MLYDPRTYLTIWLVWFIICCFIMWCDEYNYTPRWADTIVGTFLAVTVVIGITAIFIIIWS